MNLTKNTITSIMAQEEYGVSYEPLVALSTMQTVAYEALSRFKYQGKFIPPDKFFETIHEDLELFFYVESVIKTFQLQQRPKNKRLFINIDPDITTEANHVQYLLKLFSKHNNIVVEIIENSADENIEEVEHFMDWMDEYNVAYAYDDFAKPNSAFFDSLLYRASTIKLDINFIRTIRSNFAYIEFAKGLVKYAKLTNKLTVMEGIESQNDLEIAKEIGVDLVQGYLFKDQFINKWKKSKPVRVQSNSVQKSTKVAKIELLSAYKYLQDIEIDYELIDELTELEEDVLNSILVKDEITQIALEISVPLFYTYAKVLASLYEFDTLSKVLRVFSQLMENTTLEALTPSKRINLCVYLEAIILDLKKWRYAIFIEKSAEDIHYLDQTFLSSISQIELTLNGEDEKENLTEEIEFF